MVIGVAERGVLRRQRGVGIDEEELAAAGVAALYGALFSAVALYGMISKVAAGGGAAALTAFAIGVSLRQTRGDYDFTFAARAAATMAHAILLRPLPFPADETLVVVREQNRPVAHGYQ